MSENLNKVLTVIKQGESWLLDSGGYNVHLSIDGKIFAKTSKLQLSTEPKKIQLGRDKSEIRSHKRSVGEGEERLSDDQYRSMIENIRTECLDDDDNFLSLEHEYKYKKALQGWSAEREDYVEWEDMQFQIVYLVESNNPLITGFISNEEISNPLVTYIRRSDYILKEALSRINIDLDSIDTSSSWGGVKNKLTKREGYRGEGIRDLYYDEFKFFDSDSFTKTHERITLEKAYELFEGDVKTIINAYNSAYSKVHAKINEENGKELAKLLIRMESQVNDLSVYSNKKSIEAKRTVQSQVKKAKELLGI